MAREDEFTKAWRDLRLRRVLVLALLAFGGLGWFTMRLAGPNVAEGTRTWIGEAWLIAAVGSFVWLQLFRCPACAQHYFRLRGDGVNPFARRCASCGAEQDKLPQ